VSQQTPTRDFTVAVFVVHQGRVLLHFHEKLRRWLPPGGHIEPNELPDDAAFSSSSKNAVSTSASRLAAPARATTLP
jgi:hypothetical protein